MIINAEEYRKKVLGCWIGKNVGGTLGAPFEWRRQVNDVSFYTQDLGGEPLPNDDLDIQLLWLIALEEMGPDIDAHVLGEYWLLYVTPHWAEYGNAKVNLRSGLVPPLSGSFNNDYKDSCGSFIRSEIWACIAPGFPKIAAQYAYEDAIIDHGDGEGVYAEVFCAALESAAFVETDLNKLVDIALSYIPADCGVAGAVRNALESYRSGKTWLEARDAMLEKYRGSTFMMRADHTSAEDTEKGFATGKRGWDAPSNIGMLLIGLLYGEGDFDKSMTLTVNCGEDTDCTGATVGSIFGIMHGVDAIPQKWIDPIGRGIKTACLNLGELGGFGRQLPADVDDLTRRTERVARELILRRKLPLVLSEDADTDLSGLSAASLYAGAWANNLYENMNAPVFRFDFFEVAVDYGRAPTARDGKPKTVKLRLRNTYKVQANVNLRWYVPEGWNVLPSATGTVYSPPQHLGGPREIQFQLVAEKVEKHCNRMVVELTIDGRPNAMLVPVVLLNGNLEARELE